ncbi:MAG: hypothetical protein ABR585_07975 [Gemmatimonadaceae bacterium]
MERVHSLAQQIINLIIAGVALVGVWDFIRGNLPGVAMCVAGVLVLALGKHWSRWNG